MKTNQRQSVVNRSGDRVQAIGPLAETPSSLLAGPTFKKEGVEMKDKKYPAAKLVAGIAGYLTWATQNGRRDIEVLANVVHDMFEWLKNGNESWFSPRTANYEKYLKVGV